MSDAELASEGGETRIRLAAVTKTRILQALAEKWSYRWFSWGWDQRRARASRDADVVFPVDSAADIKESTVILSLLRSQLVLEEGVIKGREPWQHHTNTEYDRQL